MIIHHWVTKDFTTEYCGFFLQSLGSNTYEIIMDSLKMWLACYIALHAAIFCHSTLCGVSMSRQCTCYEPGTLSCDSVGITTLPSVQPSVAAGLTKIDLRGCCLLSLNGIQLLKFPQLELLDVRHQCLSKCVKLRNRELVRNPNLKIKGLCQEVITFIIFSIFSLLCLNHSLT